MKMRFILQISVSRQKGALFVYKQFCYLIFLLLPVLHGQARAGDIPGAPAVMPLEVLGDFSFILSNNILVLANRHEPDEYRNHQVGIQFNISPRWSIVFDNSVLTAGQLNTAAKYYAGRIDQLSLSLVYELYRTRSNPVHQTAIQLGTGFRSYGDFYGSEMHNGFHHLLKIGTDDYPYVDTAITMGTVSLKGDYQELYPLILNSADKSSWRTGYWLNATGLVSTENQLDVSLSANLLGRNQGLALWLGLRKDWRENYELDFVQQATSWTESGTSLVFGIGKGPLLFETAQGLGDKLSYSRIVFTSVENEYTKAGYPEQADNVVALNLLMPEVEAELQYRRVLSYRPNSIGQPSTWLVFDMHYGNTVYAESIDVYHPTFQPWPIYNVYSEIQQLAIGIEFDWNSQDDYRWIWPYLTLLAGERSEQIMADDGVLEGQSSERVSSTVFELGSGIRVNLYTQQKWQFLFQAGVVANYPFSSATVTLDEYEFDLLQPDLSVSMGFAINFGS